MLQYHKLAMTTGFVCLSQGSSSGREMASQSASKYQLGYASLRAPGLSRMFTSPARRHHFGTLDLRLGLGEYPGEIRSIRQRPSLVVLNADISQETLGQPLTELKGKEGEGEKIIVTGMIRPCSSTAVDPPVQQAVGSMESRPLLSASPDSIQNRSHVPSLSPQESRSPRVPAEKGRIFPRFSNLGGAPHNCCHLGLGFWPRARQGERASGRQA